VYYRFSVTPTGPVLGQTWTTGGPTVPDPGPRSGHGRVYSYNGAVVDIGDERLVGTSPVNGFVEPDPLLPYVYVGSVGSLETLNRIDAATLQVQVTDPLHTDISYISEMNRIGRDGLAIREGNFDAELYFIRNPQLVVAALAGTVSDTGSGLAEVSVNTTPVTPTGAAWSLSYPLTPGVNALIIRARDKSVPPNITMIELSFTRLLDADGEPAPR
jgi:hypothetical protein